MSRPLTPELREAIAAAFLARKALDDRRAEERRRGTFRTPTLCERCRRFYAEPPSPVCTSCREGEER